MRKSAIRLLTLSICATALLVGPAVTLASASTSGHTKHGRMSHIHQNHVHRSHVYRSHGFRSAGYRRPADQAWHATRPAIPSGQVCPGLGRSFDCKVWPPPFDEDPDRKISGSDGG